MFAWDSCGELGSLPLASGDVSAGLRIAGLLPGLFFGGLLHPGLALLGPLLEQLLLTRRSGLALVGARVGSAIRRLLLELALLALLARLSVLVLLALLTRLSSLTRSLELSPLAVLILSDGLALLPLLGLLGLLAVPVRLGPSTRPFELALLDSAGPLARLCLLARLHELALLGLVTRLAVLARSGLLTLLAVLARSNRLARLGLLGRLLELTLLGERTGLIETRLSWLGPLLFPWFLTPSPLALLTCPLFAGEPLVSS